MSIEIKQRIITESLDLFMAKGVRATAMDDIANSMGISKRTIYENFKDKDDLLLSCILYNKDAITKILRDFAKSRNNAIDMLVFFVINNRKSVINARTNFCAEIKKYHPSVFEHGINQVHKDREYEFKEIFKLGIEQGLLRDDLNFEVVSEFIMGGFLRISTDKDSYFETKLLTDKFGISYGEIVEESIKFCVYGITTTKGQKMFDKKMNEENYFKLFQNN